MKLPVETLPFDNRCLACGESNGAPLFEVSDALYGTTEDRFTVVRCCQCGLMRLTPQIPEDRLHLYYPASYWFVPDAFSRLEETYRRLVLRDHIGFVLAAYRRAGVNGLLLEVGCGGGLLLGMLAKRGVRGAGMDISAQAAASARKVNRIPALCGTLQHAPLRSGSFSVVTMFHVVEHLNDPVVHLLAARRLLRPGGRVVVQVPNADSWQFRLFGKRWNGMDVPRHLVNYRTRDLVQLLERCGFRVERIKHFNLRDNPAGFATSLAPRLDPMARRLRNIRETRWGRIAKSMLYLALTVAAIPFAIAEAAFGKGSSVMVEAVMTDTAIDETSVS